MCDLEIPLYGNTEVAKSKHKKIISHCNYCNKKIKGGALIGANSSVIKFEEVRVLKETRNDINRLVNCETANLNKTIDAAIKQIEAIDKLKKNKKFESMPNNLNIMQNKDLS